jgi:hypothetical protein
MSNLFREASIFMLNFNKPNTSAYQGQMIHLWTLHRTMFI